MNRNVLLLNVNYEPLSVTNYRRALMLLFADRATMLEKRATPLRSPSTTIDAPSVLCLRYYVDRKRREITLTKRNVIRRDGHRCQYCGTTNGEMTVDHVIPKVLGGSDSWENMICACHNCNKKKGGRTIADARMPLLRRPRKPHFFSFALGNMGEVPEDWQKYLFLS